MEGSGDRRILLFEEIDNESAKEVVEKILEINGDDQEDQLKYRDYKREPIRLYINSYGGSVYDGFSIINAIRSSKTPIYTYCLGSAMSMSLIIYLVGEKRFVSELSTFMYHELSSSMVDKLSGIRNEVEECKRLQFLIDEIIEEETAINQSDLKKYKERKSEWYINAQEAIDLKIAHEIL